jgi:hypothetical protein
MSETMSAAETWSQMLAGALSPDEATALFENAAQATESYLDSDPDAEKRVHELVERRLAEPPDADTYQVVFDSLQVLAGSDVANLVHWYAARESPADRAYLETTAGPRVLGFLRGLMARHGPELRRALAIWRELPDDWRIVDREVYFDIIRERYHIKLRIEKMNGEALALEGTPDSMLGLLRFIAVTLRWTNTADAFNPHALELFLPDLEDFMRMLRPDVESDNGRGS